MSTSLGFWEPHSASIDFCEPNYLSTHYVAEFHNAWSSLFFVLVAMIGYIYSNPMSELRVSLMFGMLAGIGIGSCALNSTLHWIWQSSDEVPMLWICLNLLFCLVNYKGKIGADTTKSTVAFVCLGVILTAVYYTYQNIYAYFIASYTLLVTVIISWSIYLVFESNIPEIYLVRRKIYGLSFFYYLVVGFSLWLFEMHNCPLLVPYFVQAHGMTFHVLWHLGAGMGTYMQISYFTILRLQSLKIDFKITWVLGGLLPLCQLVEPHDAHTK